MLARLTFSRRSALLAGLFAFAAFISPILAQNERGQLETIGRVMGLQGNMMQVEARDGVVWVVQLPNRNERITYRNTAGPKFLSPGLYVSLTGKFDKRGKMEGAATNLRVFTPESPDQLGVFPDALSGGLNPPQPQGQTSEEGDVPKSYQVSGRVTKIARNGDMMLQAGSAAVTVPVDPQVQIDVEVGTLELARPGDTVNLDAWYYPQRVGQAMATRIEVVGAQPLGVEPVAGAPAPKTPERPAFTPGFPPNPKPGSTILPNPPQPGTNPKPGSTILPNPPQPGTPKPGADPFDLK